jgi:hypothetical protein
MARLAMSTSKASSLSTAAPRQYYVTVLLDGLQSSPEKELVTIMFALADRLPSEKVLFAVLTSEYEVRQFKTAHDLLGKPGPLVVVSEANPFSVSPLPERALVDLSQVRDLDELRNIMLRLAEITRDTGLIASVKKGE